MSIRRHLRGAFLLAGVALLSLFALAGSANAITPRLVLVYTPFGNISQEAPYSGETFTELYFNFGQGECRQRYKGTVDNERPVLRDTLQELETGTPCFSDSPGSVYSTTGAYKRVSLNWQGETKVVGKVAIHTPGPCVYSFDGPTVTMSPEQENEFAGGRGDVKGALVAKESRTSCSLTDTAHLEVAIAHPPFESGPGEEVYPPLQVQLWG